MDIQRTIEALRLEGGLEISGKPRRAAEFFDGIETAISALKELQQYRQIGTLEECREAREKQKPVLAVRGKAYSQVCPKCGYPVRWPFCENCGQAIRYGHIEEENDGKINNS